MWHRWIAAAACAASLVVGGCGGEKPIRHPVSLVQERYRPRLALVEFVVKDDERRERVTRLYLEIEELTFAWQRRRLERRAQVLGLDAGEHGDLDEETLTAIFREARQENAAFFERYVDLQMALREQLTAEEFARLDEVK